MEPNKFSDAKTGQLVAIQKPKPDWAFIPDSLPAKWSAPASTMDLAMQAWDRLGTLNGAAGTLPNPELLLRPLQDREAIQSSLLEGTYATPVDLHLFAQNPQQPKSESDPNNALMEVFNYRSALITGCAALSKLPFTLNLIRDMHRKLLTGVRGREKMPGEFRNRQVGVGHDHRFIPPPIEHMMPALYNFETYINGETPTHCDRLILPFIAHYQFEAIHPFLDGNGRIGRVLLALMLYKACNHTMPWLYLSPYFERYKDEYVQKLFRISTHGEWTEWVEFCLRGIIDAANDSITRIKMLDTLKNKYAERLKISPASGRAHAIVKHLMADPIVGIVEVKNRFGKSYKTAKADIEVLTKVGILRRISNHKPATFYAWEIFRVAYSEQPEIPSDEDVAITIAESASSSTEPEPPSAPPPSAEVPSAPSPRASPPLRPPSRPSATAAGFLPGSGSGTGGVLGLSPVASWSVLKAVWLASSRLLDRFGMAIEYRRGRRDGQAGSTRIRIQSATLPPPRLASLPITRLGTIIYARRRPLRPIPVILIALSLAAPARAQEPASPPKELSPADRPAPAPIQPTSDSKQPKPADASIPGLEDSDFKVRPAPLRREGTFFDKKRGSLLRLTGPGSSGERVFIFHADDKGNAERPMILLPCTELQRMEQVTADRAEPVVFSVTGQVFAYRSLNYLLPTSAPIVQQTIAETPTPAHPASAPPAPPANSSDPSVQDLIKQLESQRDRPRTVEPGIPLAPPSDKPPAPAAATGTQPAAAEASNHVIPEGKTVLRRRARLIRSTTGNAGVGSDWAVAFDTGAQGDPDFDRPMTLIPCLTLQRMEAWAASRGDNVSLEITGQVLSYQGRNYLIPTMFRVYPSNELDPRQ